MRKAVTTHKIYSFFSKVFYLLYLKLEFTASSEKSDSKVSKFIMPSFNTPASHFVKFRPQHLSFNPDFLLSDLTLAGGSDCVHGSDWLRRACEGGRDRSGRWDLYPHAEQRVCVRGPQHLHDRPQPGT